MKQTKRQQAKAKKLQTICDQFNASYPVGTEMLLKKDGHDELFPTKTRSTAQVMSGHSAVIWLENVSGCYLLDRVTPAGLTDNQQRVFSTYSDLDEGMGYHFKAIGELSGLSRETIQSAVHHLADIGFLEFKRGCVTDEGAFYGSAYVLTTAGHAALAQGGQNNG